MVSLGPWETCKQGAARACFRSNFIRGLAESQKLTSFVSEIAGTELVPHPSKVSLSGSHG